MTRTRLLRHDGVTVPLLVLLAWARLASPCTMLIAGKATTGDGSILFAKTEDDGPREVDYLWFVDRATHPEGSVVRLRGGGTLPQVSETWAYLFDECPRTEFSNFVVNEWGVALGSNACPSREDPVEAVAARGDLKDGGLGFMLRMILAERARTAREAVELAATLLDEYGYRASGRSLNIVGPDSAWQLQMVRGKQYVARRVRDDEVAILANTYTIRDVDPGDTEGFVCSPRLIDYAIERGWYDPARDGAFDFARTYADPAGHSDPGNTRRDWLMARLVAHDFPLTWQEADQGRMPVAVKPDRKLTLDDVMSIMRSHFEGTELDDSEAYARSPHHNESRPICTYFTHRTTVVEQRDWLPPDIGTVIWRALGEPCTSGFVPWYLGAREVPSALHKAPESLATTTRELLDYHFAPPPEVDRLDLDSASCLFGLLGGLVDADYQTQIGYVRRRWAAFEQRAQALQPTVERAALELYDRDPTLARQLLAQHSAAEAAEALNIARDTVARIEENLWTGGRGTPVHLAVDLEPEQVDRLLGTYRTEPGDRVTIENHEGQLLLRTEAGRQYPLKADSKDRLFIPGSTSWISFILDGQHRVTGMVLHRVGRDTSAVKLAGP